MAPGADEAVEDGGGSRYADCGNHVVAVVSIDYGGDSIRVLRVVIVDIAGENCLMRGGITILSIYFIPRKSPVEGYPRFQGKGGGAIRSIGGGISPRLQPVFSGGSIRQSLSEFGYAHGMIPIAAVLTPSPLRGNTKGALRRKGKKNKKERPKQNGKSPMAPFQK